uniref:hypothetical protein n=1 Tax=Microcoleus sp. LEGE 07076 TaxID=915322 RepID=UPI001D14C7A8
MPRPFKGVLALYAVTAFVSALVPATARSEIIDLDGVSADSASSILEAVWACPGRQLDQVERKYDLTETKLLTKFFYPQIGAVSPYGLTSHIYSKLNSSGRIQALYVSFSNENSYKSGNGP